MLPRTNVGFVSVGREYRRRDGVNGDTKDNATLSRTTSPTMLARSMIEG